MACLTINGCGNEAKLMAKHLKDIAIGCHNLHDQNGVCPQSAEELAAFLSRDKYPDVYESLDQKKVTILWGAKFQRAGGQSVTNAAVPGQSKPKLVPLNKAVMGFQTESSGDERLVLTADGHVATVTNAVFESMPRVVGK